MENKQQNICAICEHAESICVCGNSNGHTGAHLAPEWKEKEKVIES